MKLEGRCAIVTGGGSGMGAETARHLARAGAKVAVLDINEDAVKELAQEIDGLAVACDVTSEESVQAALETVMQAYGHPRALIHCAGILMGKLVLGKKGPFDLSVFQKVVDVNLVGTFNMLRLTAEAMSQADPVGEDDERGVIINAASIAAYEGQIGQAAYSASKGGVVSMTLPIARELARFGIRVMAIAPGAMETPMMQEVSDELRESIESKIPFPSRFGKPHEFASLAMQIIDNPMLNGSTIRLDGAARLEPK